MFGFLKDRLKQQIRTYKNLGFETPARSKTRNILSMILTVLSLLVLAPAGIHILFDSCSLS